MKNGNPPTQQHFCQKMHIAHQIVYYNYDIEIYYQFIQVIIKKKKKKGQLSKLLIFLISKISKYKKDI